MRVSDSFENNSGSPGLSCPVDPSAAFFHIRKYTMTLGGQRFLLCLLGEDRCDSLAVSSWNIITARYPNVPRRLE